MKTNKTRQTRIRTLAALLGVFICFAIPDMFGGVPQDGGLSLEFVSCDTNGKMLVRIKNNTPDKITIPANESSLGVDSMRVIVAEKESDEAPYMLRRIVGYDIGGPGSVATETVPAKGCVNRETSLFLWASKYYPGSSIYDSSSIDFSSKDMPKFASLHVGDTIIVVYKVPGQEALYSERRRVQMGVDAKKWAEMGGEIWTGVLVCHGVVQQAKPEGQAKDQPKKTSDKDGTSEGVATPNY